MNQVIVNTPATLSDVFATNNYIIVKNLAEAYNEAGKRFDPNNGPIVSRKILFDKEKNKAVYEYYRVRNKAEKIYVIL